MAHKRQVRLLCVPRWPRGREQTPRGAPFLAGLTARPHNLDGIGTLYVLNEKSYSQAVR